MDHKNKILELIKDAFKSEKFKIKRTYGNAHKPNHKIPHSRIRVNYLDNTNLISTKSYAYHGFYSADMGEYNYYHCYIEFRIEFEDDSIPPILLGTSRLNFKKIKQKCSLFNYFQSILGIEKHVKYTIEADLKQYLATIEMGDVGFGLDALEYSTLAQELIQILKNRKETDFENCVKKINEEI